MAFFILVCLLCIFTEVVVVSSPTRTLRDQVLSIEPQSDEEIQFIKQISNQYKAVLWQPSSINDIRINKEIHLYINASNIEEMKTELATANTTYRVMIEDVQQLIKKQKEREAFQPRGFSSYYENYHSLEEKADAIYTIVYSITSALAGKLIGGIWISLFTVTLFFMLIHRTGSRTNGHVHEIYLWMSQITKAHPFFIQKIFIGPSSEKRLIYALKVFKGTDSPKGALWIDCGIHAREWIAPAFCQWFVQYLLDTQDKVITDILNSFEIYVLPVWNVDGYEYTWTTNRFWRKNLSTHNKGRCIGTDLNRNWDVSWCDHGASHNPCSETYCGRYPESEPEVKAVATFIRQRSNHIKCYISIHSYSQMVMFPYSYKMSMSKDHAELNFVAWKAVTALRSVHGSSYEYGNSAKTIYLSSGCSDDWAYDLGIKYSFTFELRDHGKYGFLLPPYLIKPTCEEATAAVREILFYAIQNI